MKTAIDVKVAALSSFVRETKEKLRSMRLSLSHAYYDFVNLNTFAHDYVFIYSWHKLIYRIVDGMHASEGDIRNGTHTMAGKSGWRGENRNKLRRVASISFPF